MSMKNGFSTLNRLLGKKNKDKNLSKSSTNLSLSSNHIDTSLSSHLQTQNRITPLPVATSNAPFEQTFRITVLLPREQMYVVRLGAKIKLEKLMELVCDNKQLDSEIYEFRHPTDTSQTFNLELTIGSVGLNEIRLCHKSETYDNFNADEIIKLRHQTVGRDSLSSSEFSSRNSKNTKTASPYSSTNSLNSIDSTGMNTNYRAPLSLPSPASMIQSQQTNTTKQQQMTTVTGTTTTKFPPPKAPARKKRLAPRPPSQISIPEKEIITNSSNDDQHHIFKSPMPRKEFHLSTPNLSTSNGLSTSLKVIEFHQSNLSIDCNGNSNKNENNNFHKVNGYSSSSDINQNSKELKQNGIDLNNQPVSIHIPSRESTPETNSNDDIERKSSVDQSSYGSVQSLKYIGSNACNTNSGEELKLPEPSPRNKIVVVKKKTAAPAPPPRNIIGPIATPRISTATTGSMLSLTEPNQIINKDKTDSSTDSQQSSINGNNISKVMLNQSEEYSPPSSPNVDSKNCSNLKLIATNIETNSSSTTNNEEEFFTPLSSNDLEPTFILSTHSDDTQADSGIGEPIPSPTLDSLPQSENSQYDESIKSHFESSSDDDEHVKVYNLKLGKTISKPIEIQEHKTMENLTNLEISPTANNTTTVTTQSKTSDNLNKSISITNIQNDTNSLRSNSPSWTYTIPAPPNFADTDESPSSVKSESSSTESACDDMKFDKSNDDTMLTKIHSNDEPITPVIKERSPLNFEVYSNNFDSQQNVGKIIESKEDSNNCEIFKKCKPRKKIDEIINDKDCVEDRNDNEKKDLVIMKSEVNDIEKVENLKNSDKITNIKDYNNETNINTEIQLPFSTHSFTKSDVIIELNNVISENGFDNIIKKTVENDLDPIESATTGQCNLSNFKITTYSPPNTPVKMHSDERSDLGPSAIDSELYKEFEIIDKQDEKLYRKNSSLNVTQEHFPTHIFKNRRSITRSDSFHSTVIPRYDQQQQQQHSSQQQQQSLKGSRSSSFLSLLAAQKQENSMKNSCNNSTNLTSKFIDTNRRKSSSELSIGESPSLQSLIVMKSILNSGLNNSNNKVEIEKSITLLNENDLQSVAKVLQHTKTTSDDDAKSTSNNNDLLPKTTTTITNNNHSSSNGFNDTDDGLEKSDDQPEKKWKYQGPPSINLSTWNERPKIQSVTIKNEGDYIIGNTIKLPIAAVTTTTSSISTMTRSYNNHRNSMPASTFSIQQYPNLNSHITTANNATTSAATPSAPSNIFIKQHQIKVPFVRSVEYKKMNSANIDNINKIKLATEQQQSPPVCPPKPLSSGNTMTLGRIPKINKQTVVVVPTVKGFQNLDNNLNDSDKESVLLEQQKHQQPCLKLNSTEQINKSATIQNGNHHYRYSYAGGDIDELIEMKRNQNEIDKSNVPVFAQITLRKTGLKDKILACNNSSNSNNNVNSSKNLIKNYQNSNEENKNCAKLDMKFKNENNALVAPQPPLPPIIRSVVTKQNSTDHSATNSALNQIQIDPRNQLLAAIRNFQKDDLKRS